MILVKMQVAKGVNEIARPQIDHLRDHQGEERIRRDVEGHAQKKISATLIKLAAQLAILHVKLKEDVARRQRHPLNLRGVPRVHDQAPALRIFFDLRDDIVDLIDAHAILAAPIAPLRAVNAPEVAMFIRPLVPNRHAVLVEITNVGVAAQEPEQLVDDRFEMQLLCREQRKIFAQIKPRLRAEDR